MEEESRADLEKHSWNLLFRATQKHKEAFRTPVLISLHDDWPEARTVVLRDIDTQRKRLLIHTDIRSPKIAQIQANEQIAWLFYDARRQIQLRLRGRGIIHHQNEFSQKQWDKTGVGSLKVYGTQLAPGTAVEKAQSGLISAWDEGKISREESEMGLPNFAVIESPILSLEYLRLAKEGHRRAYFTYTEEGQINHSEWRIP